MKRIFREPLLHFLLIGAAFFLLYSIIGEGESLKDTIVIDESDLDEVVSKFEMQWKRVPTEEELTAIVEKRIEQEIFYQEALKMNLDHNDEIIKRRLSQKMQFLSDDLSALVEPTEAELTSFYNENQDRYLKEAVYTIYQVFFSPDMRENWRADAQNSVRLMNDASFSAALTMGDPIALPSAFEETSAFHISRQMGDAFLKSIGDLELNKWVGPVESGYGAHVVFIASKTEEEIADYNEVRESVLEDFNFVKQQEVKASILTEFKKKYNVSVDVSGDNYSQEFVQRLEAEIEGE